MFFIAAFQMVAAGDENIRKLQPRLVVGVVVDQMRYDYLYRFYDQYSEKGFKRLMSEGMNFTYAHFNYIPTYTGPGHASIYTGTIPYYHGIISNSWYDKILKKSIYCADDLDVTTVGADHDHGRVSPENLLATTMTDQLRMSNNGLSRVYALSIKDRAAILPGGHMANAAYWYDENSGNFISSSWYMKALPLWVEQFNSRKFPEQLMLSEWQLESGKDYQVSMPDDGPGENDIFKEGKTTFPHQFTKLTRSEKLDAIKSTPFGNDLLADFFIDLLKNEKAGQGLYCDFISLSFSSPDYIGHSYGPNSMEIMDTYLKLDNQIARILDTLDRCIGKGNYLLFLTADHGVKPNNAYLEANRIKGGHVVSKGIREQLSTFCKDQFGHSHIIEAVEANQIYLDHALLDSLRLSSFEVENMLINYMRDHFQFMGKILTRKDLVKQSPERSMNSFLINGYNILRAGDIAFEFVPNYILSGYGAGGTSHESQYDYDTHVPLLFYGWHIEPGESNQEVFIEDIAPTITNLIHVQEPDATIGIPIIQYK